MKIESLIKNGIAEHICEILLEQAGYVVVRIGRQGLLGHISRSLTHSLNKSDSAGKITTAPSFAIFDENGSQITLVKIKYRGQKSKGKNISHGLKQLVDYWPEAIMLLVTSESPYFQVMSHREEELPIEKYFPEIKKSLAEGIEMVKKFL